MNDSEPIDWELADFRARVGFYRAMQAEGRELFRRGQPLPVMPPNDELTFVDGFLIWKGRPVWYSGEGRGARAAANMDGPGFVETALLAGPREAPAPRRSGLRRLVGVWRALAYGHAS